MKIRVWLLCLLIDLFVIAGRAEGEPYLLGSAWPVMRGDLQNTGRGKLGKWEPSSVRTLDVRRFQTGNGIFSTPVIDANERIYVGSADHYFYAFDPIAGSAGVENALINRAYPGFRISQMAQFLKTPACLWN